MSSSSTIWQDIKERFEFFLILAALCGCGYLTWYQFIWIILMLIFGGVSAAMIPLYNIAQEKLNDTKYFNESELKTSKKILQEAENILYKYEKKRAKLASQNSIQANNKLRKIQKTIIQNIEEAQQESEKKKRQREEREEYITNERRRRGFTCGVPPDDISNECPPGYQIRVTQNLQDDPHRGIYYRPGERDYKSKATWCFKNEKEAKENNFRCSKRSQRKSR